MPPVFGPSVAVERPLEVLSERQREDVPAVGDGQAPRPPRRSGAPQDHHSSPGVAERPADERRLERGARHGPSRGRWSPPSRRRGRRPSSRTAARGCRGRPAPARSRRTTRPVPRGWRGRRTELGRPRLGALQPGARRTTGRTRGARRRGTRRPAQPPGAPRARHGEVEPRLLARAARPSMSEIGTGRHVASSSMPGFPGAAHTSATEGGAASDAHSACSRAPPPTTRTLIRSLHGEGRLAAGPDRHVTARARRPAPPAGEVGAGLGGQVAERVMAPRSSGHPRRVLVHRLGLVEDRLVGRKILVLLALVAVGRAQLKLLQAGQDVELGHEQLGERVHPGRVPEQHGVEPPAAPGPPGRSCRTRGPSRPADLRSRSRPRWGTARSRPGSRTPWPRR